MSSRFLAIHVDAVTHGDELHGGHRLRRKSRHETRTFLRGLVIAFGASVVAWAAVAP